MTYTINSKIVIGKTVYTVIAIQDTKPLTKELTKIDKLILATKGNSEQTYMIKQMVDGTLIKPYKF